MVVGGLAAGAAGGIGINIVIRAIDNFSKTFALAQTQVAGLGGFIQKHKAGIMLAGAAITGATAMIASSSIKAFGTFQRQLIDSMNMFDNVTDEMRSNAGELAISLSKELGISAVDAAEALFFFGSAGMDINETMEAMPTSLRFARANVLDMAEASNFALTIMKVWGEEADALPGILDKVTFAMKNAKLNMSMMAESFKYVAPVAADLGISISEAAVLTGVLADAGITGSMAGTVLRRSLLNLTSPTKAQKEVMEELGITIFDSEGKFRGILPVLEQFENVTKTMSDEQRSATLKTIFGARAVAGMSAILKRGVKDIRKYTEEVENADGAVGEMLNNMEDGIDYQLKQFQASVEEIKISLGETLVPVLIDVLDAIKPMLEWFGDLGDDTQRNIILFTGLAGAALILAPGLVAVGQALPAVIAGLGKLAGFTGLKLPAISGLLAVGAAVVLTIEGFKDPGISWEELGAVIATGWGLTKLGVARKAAWRMAGGLLILSVGVELMYHPEELGKQFGKIIGHFVWYLAELVDIVAEIMKAIWQIMTFQDVDWSKLKESFGNLGLFAEAAMEGVVESMKDNIQRTERVPTLITILAGGKGEVEKLIAGLGLSIERDLGSSITRAETNWLGFERTANRSLASIIGFLTSIGSLTGGLGRRRSIFGLNIPFFQQGGIMPYTGLAMLHKGETVTPTTGEGVGGTTISIENIYGMDPTDVAEAFADAIGNQIRI